MWAESRFHVGNGFIGVRVHRLDADECERTAALLALEAFRSPANARLGPWREFVSGLPSQRVALFVPDACLRQAGTGMVG